MPKTPRPQPDAMVREVDRLLAQLAHVGAQPGRDGGVPRVVSPAPPRVTRPRSAGVVPSSRPPARGGMVALWARVLLGIGLGSVMTQWPYPYECGLLLLGYLGAVTMVLLTGAWIAFASWKLRAGLPHILSLILVFWGLVLAAEQLLPRIGYAADRASWGCSS